MDIHGLVEAKVVGDVLDMFTPVVELEVRYGAKRVFNGLELRLSECVDKPHVQFSFHAPSPENLLLIVIDIPQGGDASKGKEVVEYMGPKPPAGTHRYVMALYQQRGLMGKPKPMPDARSNFNTRQFAAENDLGLPLAALYFTSHPSNTEL